MDDRRIRMHETVKQNAEKECGCDAWRVESRGLVAQHHADHADDQRRQQPRECAAGEVFVAERDEREHAEAHRQRDRKAC